MPSESSMLIVVGRVGARPDRRQELIELLRWMQRESRREPGCLNYGFYESVGAENEFIAVEEWESVGALRTHFGASSVAGFAGRIGGLVAGVPEIRIHGVGATSDFPDLTPFDQD
jgi:quinol monooxygenase YgiN